jgi:inorganic pyrophosphatase
MLNNACNHLSGDFSKLPTFNEQGNLQVVIENSAGATKNLIYDFEIKGYTDKGQLKKPYPANKGFVPSTRVNTTNDNVIYPLEVFVVGKPLMKGEILSVKPIAILKFKDEDILKYNIVVVPSAKELSLNSIHDFEEFSLNYVELRQKISECILNQYENKSIELLGWYDEEEALRIIKKHQIKTG